MNKDRRATIATIRKALEEAASPLEDIKGHVEAVEDDERGAHESLPEAMAETEQAEKMVDAIEALAEAAGLIDEILEQFEGLQNTLEAAAQ